MNKKNKKKIEEDYIYIYDNNKEIIKYNLCTRTEEIIQTINNVTCIEVCDSNIFVAINQNEEKISSTPEPRIENKIGNINTSEPGNNNKIGNIIIRIYSMENLNINNYYELKTDHKLAINIFKINKNQTILLCCSPDSSKTYWKRENIKDKFRTNYCFENRSIKILKKVYEDIYLPTLVTICPEIICSNFDNNIHLLLSGTKICQAHNEEITSLLLTSKEDKVISGSKDCTIKIWNYINKEKKFLSIFKTISTKKPILALCFDTEEKYLFSGSDSLIQIWNIYNNDPEVISHLDFQFDSVKRMEMSNSGTNLILRLSDDSIIYFKINEIKNNLIQNNNLINTFSSTNEEKNVYFGCKNEEDRAINQSKINTVDEDIYFVKRLCLEEMIIYEFNQSKGHKNEITGILITLDQKKLITTTNSKNKFNFYLNL